MNTRVPVMTLGGQTRLPQLLTEKGFDQRTADRVRLPKPVPKLAIVVAGICADADTIDDIDVLRKGRMRALSPGRTESAEDRDLVAGVQFRIRRQWESVLAGGASHDSARNPSGTFTAFHRLIVQ
jgi:hypothetical protein